MGLSFDSPSPRSWDALIAIESFLGKYEMAPTYRELANELGIRAVSAARRHVELLTELGLLTTRKTGRKGQMAARSIRLTEEGRKVLAKHRAMWGSGIFRGQTQLVLTDKQLERARGAGVPVESFEWSEYKGRKVLWCRNWRERDFWGEKILEELQGGGGD